MIAVLLVLLSNGGTVALKLPVKRPVVELYVSEVAEAVELFTVK
jgi:hypothetical protein